MILKGIGTKSRQKLAIVAAKDIITPTAVSQSLHIPQQEAGRILSRWSHAGWVKRLKHGVYIAIELSDTTGESSIEDSWILADSLFSPGYIGGFSAIKHWDFSEQLFETTFFLTTKKVNKRQLVVGHTRFHLKTIKEYKLFGTKTVWRGNKKILISDPTKTIVDILDDPTLVGGMRIVQDVFSEYNSSTFFDMEKLIRYTEKMKNKTIFKRLAFLMETMGLSKMVEDYNLLYRISKGYSLFDPSTTNTKTISKWKLKIPPSWIKND